MIQLKIKMTRKTKYKVKSKKKKTQEIWGKEKPMLLDEVCWCCSKLLQVHKKVRREYQLTRHNSKAQ
jgi:hypothetical protein